MRLLDVELLNTLWLRGVKKQNKIICYKGTRLILNKTSKIKVDEKLKLNYNMIKDNGRTTILRMDENSEFVVGNFSVYYGGDIICFKNSKLEIGSGFVNSNVKIRCTESIKIGEDVAISHNVTIMDSDAHEIINEGYKKTKPIVIGNHVWIGSGAMILKGVRIGDGTVIAAGSIVTHDFPNNCIAAGIPAKIIKKDVTWK
ncbi:acyltransferase [Clostridium sp. BL-8]|uniref:acyltransferase n=1 Tax=Clostridium sp. BL-8 TaxID=349938 RepID=UPI00098C82D7|nr:acyltransferase [Clostridium sp. BL-8]OOM79435.1 galactoside O-acetyltransferase [Clostridium sp. BL-8]